MKILFSLTYYFPYISGLTIYTQKVAEGLAERGYCIEILTSQHSKSLPKREKIGKVLVTRIPYLLKLSKGFLMPQWTISGYNKIKECDVLICNYPQVEGIWLLFLGKIFGKRTILVYQCDVVLPKGLLNRVIEKLLYLLNFLSCLMADSIINTSQDYAINSPLLAKFIKKIEFVFPPVKDFSLEKGEVSPGEKLLLKSLQEYKMKIGFVGRISAEKGINYLFESISYLEKSYTDFGIFLVGPLDVIGEKDYLNKIKLLREKNKNKIFLLGKLSDSALANFYKNIDVLVLPSVNSTEAFGMVQVEAMLVGTPVAVSDLPGVRVPVKKTGMGEIFPAFNSRAMAAAITKVLKNKNKYIKKREEINRIFSTRKTIDLYEKIIASSFQKKQF